MKAVILAGGFGTRLRPYTFSIPKPLLPVGDKPVLELIIEQLRDSGIKDIILATGYKSEIIQSFCGNGSRFNVNINYVSESRPLGTAGPISIVRRMVIKDRDFILMNGDIVTKLNFRDMVNFHRTDRNELTVGYKIFKYQSPFGVLEINNNLLAGIIEKPVSKYAISAGIYVLNRRIIDLVPKNVFYTMPELIKKILKAGHRVGIYKIKEFWLGLENIEHFDLASRRINKIKTIL